MFIALGAKGSIELALEVGILPDPSGKITVDENCRTEMEKVYACGDVTGTPWQLARAVGPGLRGRGQCRQSGPSGEVRACR